MRRSVPWWLVTLVGMVGSTLALSGGGPGAGDPAQPAATSIDSPGDVVVDQVTRDGRRVEIVGWRRGGGPVEIIADGAVVARVQADRHRPDVAIATGDADRSPTGFVVEVDVPRGTFLVCATTPDASPARGSCDRAPLDLEHQRAVAFYGVPGVPALGTLGSGTPRNVRRRLERQAEPYRTSDRPVMLVFEIIATVAQAAPGRDGDFSEPIPTEDIWTYLREIRRVGGHVVLDFQPGQGDYLEQMEAVEELLVQPDVHVALDPEWDMLPGQRPAQVVGHTSAVEINRIMRYLRDLVLEHRLPAKLVIVQQFQDQMIRKRPRLDPPEGVALLLQMDGHGPPWLKTGNYARLADARFLDGFKLFYQRDFPRLRPREVLRLRPEPDYISYQ